MSTVLRESSETAKRERLRLETVAGSSRVIAVLRRASTRLRHLGSEDAAKSGLRYQPVAWTAIVLAAIAFYFPGRSDSGGDAPVAQPAATIVQAPPTTLPAQETPPTTVPLPSATLTPAPTTFTTTPSVAAPPATTTPESAPAPVALSVRGFGWASSLSGSAVSTNGVPEGTMPVANRLGQLDKASFLRLAGTATTLTLIEDTDGAREAIGAGTVVICPITDAGWAEKPDQSLDDAPAWNADACIAGTEKDNTWVFDLSSFGDPSAQNGFALVPDAGAPADFQVTFRAT